MLILSRKVNDRICIGNNIVVVVRSIKGDRVSLGVEAPKEILVMRGELAKPQSSVKREATCP